MEISRRALPPERGLNPRAQLSRRFGVAAFAALAVQVCSGASTFPKASRSSSGTIGASTGEVVGGAVGIGAGLTAIVVILVEVNHSHHTLDGCVSSGPNGLELQNSDSKRFMLEGDSASVKAGDRVKLHGSRVKKTKDTTGNPVFNVQSLKKDYGPCHVTPAG